MFIYALINAVDLCLTDSYRSPAYFQLTFFRYHYSRMLTFLLLHIINRTMFVILLA